MKYDIPCQFKLVPKNKATKLISNLVTGIVFRNEKPSLIQYFCLFVWFCLLCFQYYIRLCDVLGGTSAACNALVTKFSTLISSDCKHASRVIPEFCRLFNVRLHRIAFAPIHLIYVQLLSFPCARTQYLFIAKWFWCLCRGAIASMLIFFRCYIKRIPLILLEVRFIELNIIRFSTFSFKWKIIMWILALEHANSNKFNSEAKRSQF